MAIDYGTAKYTIRDAAAASGIALNTLRSLYAREHFRIVGGDAKKGRGLAAELTLPDIMCIAVAKAAIDAGVHPRVAFEAGMAFAYSSSGGPSSMRLPSQLFQTGFTVLVCHPVTGGNKVIQTGDGLGFTDLFIDRGFQGRQVGVVILLNDVERAVFQALRLNEPRE